MHFHITYQPHLGRPAETINAERADPESTGPHLVFRSYVPVMNVPREIVVRRLLAADVLSMETTDTEA